MSPELAWADWSGERQRRIEDVLARALPAADLHPEPLSRAMRYAVLDGGKRMRPLLAYAGGELTGADADAVDAPAAAVELIHAYSLIHDDLPCMDDDTLRRGRVAFGEAGASRRRRAAGACVRRACRRSAFRSNPCLCVACRCRWRARDGGRTGDRSRQRRCRAAGREARDDASDENRCADPRRRAARRRLRPDARPERGARARSRRRGPRFSGRRQCSTSKDRWLPSARRPARTSRRASRPSCRASVSPRPRLARRRCASRRGRHSRHSVRGPVASRSSPTGSCCGCTRRSRGHRVNEH